MLQPGTQIGRYEVQRRLGRGGMGTVYVAHDPVLGRMVAIKVFLSDLDLPDAAQRFAREARSAAALNHANIVTIHDFGDWQSQPFIVMEYVQGETLAELIRRKAPVPMGDKLRLMEELCAGVSYAHQVGVVHRDIKPTNLMIDRSGRLKILDFGIARMLGTISARGTALIGTPGYMAPEQIVGGTIDQRSDLFSIAVVCYELLTYTDAFPGESIPAITHRIIHDEPAPLVQLLPDASPDLIAIVERGLRKAAADRFADAESFRQALVRVRRDLEGGPDWASTAPSRGGASGAGAGATLQRGTGSARRPVGDAVGVLTPPPPDPQRKTDREAAIERRRVTQIEQALEQARQALQQQELDQALDACQQALMLDGSHAVAQDLEEVIKAAMAKRRAGSLLADARDELAKGALTAAQNLLQEARTLDPEVADAKRLERELKLARVEQERLRQRADAAKKALAAGRDALNRGEVEPALTFAREALDLDPELTDAQALEADAMRRLDDEVGEPTVAIGASPVDKTVLAPPRRTPAPARAPAAAGTPAPAGTPASAAAPAAAGTGTKIHPRVVPRAPAVKTTRRDPSEWLRRAAGTMAQTARSVERRVVAIPRRQQMLIAAALVVVAVVVYVVTRPAPVVPTGSLIIDAVPWATITAVRAQDGTNRTLPSPASTPLLLALPVGTYEVRLQGPPPGSESRVVTIEVREGAVASTSIERFETLTPETYFEGYLTAPAAQEPAAPTDPAAAPGGAPSATPPQPTPPPATPPPGAVP